MDCKNFNSSSSISIQFNNFNVKITLPLYFDYCLKAEIALYIIECLTNV